MTAKKRIWYWLPTLLWTLVIFAFSARPALHASGVDWQDFLIKKTAHFVEYFILAFLASRSFSLTTKLSRWQIFTFSFLFASLYAVSDEFHQSFVPGREPHLRDVAIDSFGGLCAAFTFFRIHHASPNHTTG